MPLPKNAVAVTPGGAVKQSMIAGYVTMFTVPDDAVSATKLTRTFAALDLDTDLLPPTRRSADVFKSACREVEAKGNGSHKRAEVVVDELMETGTEVVYQVTRRIRDRENRVIDHPKAMRVSFKKDDESMVFEPLEPSHYKALSGLEDAIREWYDKNATKVPGYKIRSVLRSYMEILGATNLRRKAGGVYFVPARGKDTLDSLSEALDKLYGAASDLHTIPLVNDEGAREMIQKHFTINATGQIDDLMAKINEALHGTRERKIRADFLGNVIEKRRAIAKLKNDYAGLLESELTELASKIEDLDNQVEALTDATTA